MEKIKIKLADLEQIRYKRSFSPEDTYLEQIFSYNDDGSYTHYYKCPCGKGRVVDDKDATPGFRSHEIYIECGDCREKYELY